MSSVPSGYPERQLGSGYVIPSSCHLWPPQPYQAPLNRRPPVFKGPEGYTNSRKRGKSLANADGMPSRTTASQVVNRTGKRRLPAQNISGVDPDEHRLLGGGGQHDPNAVRIGIPRSSRVEEEDIMNRGKLLGGGPRPRNTLNRPFNTYEPHSTHEDHARSNRISHRTLDLETSRGSNLMLQVTSEDSTAQSPKRRKVSHQTSSENSSISMEDPINNIPPEQVDFGIFQGPSRATSSQALGQLRNPGAFTIAVPEFRSIERTMNPGTRDVKRSRSKGSQRSQSDTVASSPPLLTPTSKANPMDTSGDDELQFSDPKPKPKIQPIYRGTARALPTSTGTAGSTFQYSSQRTSATNGLQPVGFKRSPEPRLPSWDQCRGQNLRDQFVSANGQLRGADRRLSSDPLNEEGTTVGKNADLRFVSPTKPSRPNSPSRSSPSTIKSLTNGDDNGGLPASSIKPTKFASSHSPRRPKSPAPTKRPQEREANWGIDISAINYHEDSWTDHNMSLEYNTHEGVYYVHNSGQIIPYLQVQPKKLLKIWYGVSGGKVRFESSKCGKDDHVLDLEFSSQKDVVMLLKRLQHHVSTKIISRESQHMDAIFEKRRSEFQRKSSLSNVNPADPEDIQLAAIKKIRREAKQQKSPVRNCTERTRTSTKLVDGLLDSARREPNSHTDLHDEGTPAIPHGLPDLQFRSEIPNILRRLQPKHNAHLGSGVRSSGNNDKYEGAVSKKEIPAVKKYSKDPGLGPIWSKPLTYPKTGKKKTTVEWEDLERLDEGEFLNDNLISFYLRFLEHTIGEVEPETAKRIYFFNTFFFASLTNTPRGKQGVNYEGVQKWTRTVDLFTYDYIVVPINESSHWYLAIICNLPALNRTLSRLDDVSPLPSEAAEGDIEGGQPAPSPVQRPVAGASVVEDEQEPGEMKTTESFAEMSLENGGVLPSNREFKPVDNPGDRDLISKNTNEEDQEMLDVPVEAPTEEVAAMLPTDAQRASEADTRNDYEHDPIEDLEDLSKTSAAFKKRKRKSRPPITKVDPNEPAIIIFDSLGLNHAAAVRALKLYLHEEAKAKRGGMELNIAQIKGINAKEIPEQDNYSDCGLFMLGYVAKFLENDPREFIAKIIQRAFDKQKDWPKLVPSNMRANIRDQVQKLHTIQRDERRESAQKAGKYGKSRNSTAPKGNIKGQKSSDSMASRDSSNAQSPTPAFSATRNDALKRALSIDDHDLMGSEPKDSDIMTATEPERPHPITAQRHTIRETQAPTHQEASFVLIESQSQSQHPPPTSFATGTNPQTQVLDYEERELPSEIQDSQPSQSSGPLLEVIQKEHPNRNEEVPQPQSAEKDQEQERGVQQSKRRKSGRKARQVERIIID